MGVYAARGVSHRGGAPRRGSRSEGGIRPAVEPTGEPQAGAARPGRRRRSRTSEGDGQWTCAWTRPRTWARPSRRNQGTISSDNAGSTQPGAASSPAIMATSVRAGIDRARDRLLGLGGQALAAETPARLPLEVADHRHAERREQRQQKAENTRFDVVAPDELQDAACRGVSREQQERDADPVRQHLVAPGMVLFLVGQVAQVPHGQQGGAPFDHAFDSECEQGQAPGAHRLVEGKTALAEDVEEGQPEQPAHAAVEGLGVRPAGGCGTGRQRGRLGFHPRILCRPAALPAPGNRMAGRES